jgi:hypothetical protein
MARPTGITTRHSRRCRSRSGGGCNCDPSYEAWVWSQRDGRKIRKTFAGKGALSAAKGWRHDPGSAVRKGTMQAPTRQTLTEAAETWLEGAKGGAILTRSGRPHKPAVIRGYEADLRRYVLPDLGAHRRGASTLRPAGARRTNSSRPVARPRRFTTSSCRYACFAGTRSSATRSSSTRRRTCGCLSRTDDASASPRRRRRPS